MFNDLNSQANSGHQSVDDIFAETDKPSTNGVQSDIETHNVGLASGGENLPPVENEPVSGSRNYLKIIIIITLSLAVLGGAYLVYSQFFKNNERVTESLPIPNQETKTDVTTPVTPAPVADNFVSVIPGVATTTDTPVEVGIPSEVVSSETTTASSSTGEVEIPAVLAVDSDSDGLTDAEETAAGTNLNIIDTDIDGLSDYDEVIVYKTDPLNNDTDGDTYFDGAEVQNKYNPCGDGKLPATSSLEELCAQYKK